MKKPGIHTEKDTQRQVIRLAVESVIGREEALRIMPANGQPAGQEAHAGSIQAALEKEYGNQAGRGLAVRVGRACLGYSLRTLGTESGLTDREFRLLPLPKRLREGSRKLADLFTRIGAGTLTPTEDENRYLFAVNKSLDIPCCAIALGFIQEAYYWLSGGRNFQVVEDGCCASGNPVCNIQVDRVPIG